MIKILEFLTETPKFLAFDSPNKSAFKGLIKVRPTVNESIEIPTRILKDLPRLSFLRTNR